MCSPDMPGPDPAIGEAQRILAQNSTEMLQFFKDYYKDTLAPLQQKQSALTEKLTEDYLAGRAEQRGVEQENMERFRRLYQPLEEQTVRDAAEYDSAGNIARRSGIAAANVSQSYSNARDQNTRALSRMGINPNSSAFAATNDRLTRAQALDTAGARTGAAFDTMDKGIALRSGAVAQGRGLPNIAGQFAQIGNQSGAQAGAQGQSNLAGAQNVGSFMGQGYSAANAGMAQSGQLGVANYNAQVNAANVQGNPLMEVLGMGARFAGTATGAKLFGLADGGTVDARRGGAIRGPGTETSDSIPALLSDGEYVLNAESVKMIGKQKLDKMNKAGLKRRALKGR